jgi:hypothetical protein
MSADYHASNSVSPRLHRSDVESRLSPNDRGTDSALIELQLSHAKRDKVAGVYDRSERRESSSMTSALAARYPILCDLG